jgi:hypothetical protein
LSATATAVVSVNWNFTGFFRPVENLPVRNRAHAGSAIPIKFSLHGYQGLDILAEGYPRAVAAACDAAIADDGEEAALSTSVLIYDASADRYGFVWKTDKHWSGTCRRLILELRDGTEHQAEFRFVK